MEGDNNILLDFYDPEALVNNTAVTSNCMHANVEVGNCGEKLGGRWSPNCVERGKGKDGNMNRPLIYLNVLIRTIIKLALTM